MLSYEQKKENEEDVCCRDCDYTWTKQAFENGDGRIAFSHPADFIEEDEVVCSLCYIGTDDISISDDDDDEIVY